MYTKEMIKSELQPILQDGYDDVLVAKNAYKVFSRKQGRYLQSCWKKGLI